MKIPAGALAEMWSLITGVTRRPVEAYEKIAQTPGSRGAVAFIALITLAVAATGSVRAAIRVGNGAVPPGGSLAGGIALSLLWAALGVLGVYFAASAVIWLVGRALGSRGSLSAFLTAWAGSYVPTVVWFAGLLLAHVLTPLGPEGPVEVNPGSFWFPSGVGFQVIFLAFSVACFLWKSLLLYLTLRVVGRLDFRRIVAAAVILAPVAVGYWWLGLRMGWFKVPVI